MLKEKLITTEELSPFGSVSNRNDKAVALVKQQQETWELAGKNYTALGKVQAREFNFGHFHIRVQHNPARMRSSAAKTDPHTIAGRPCFLCYENLPLQQKALPFEEDYLLLANPFPIFPVHLTIVHKEHIPQRLDYHFPEMLKLSKSLAGFTVFYNGPQCGASAPDHFHFQAGNRGLLPVEEEVNRLITDHSRAVFQQGNVMLVAVEDYLRRCVVLISPDRGALIDAFSFLYPLLGQDEQQEPMLNVLSFYENEKWYLVIFPRDRQRPSHFFRTGRHQVIVGPAAVEMGGLLILPRQQDFENINPEIITEIYTEVTLSATRFELLIENIAGYMKKT